MAKRYKAFPPKLFIVKEDPDNNGGYFVAEEDESNHASVGNTARVAVYELVEVREVTGVVQSRVV